jgi:hypothetical protein
MQLNNEIKTNEIFTVSNFGNGVFVDCVCGSKLNNKEKTLNKHLLTKKHKLYIQSLNPQTMDLDGKRKMISHHRNSIKKHQKNIRLLEKKIKSRVNLLKYYESDPLEYSDNDTDDELELNNSVSFIQRAEARVLQHTQEITNHTNKLNNIMLYY